MLQDTFGNIKTSNELIKKLAKNDDNEETSKTVQLLNSFVSTSKEILDSNLSVRAKVDFLILNFHRFNESSKERKFDSLIKKCILVRYKSFVNSLIVLH